MIKKTTLFALFLFMAISINLVSEEQKDFSISIDSGSDMMFGYTLYSIGWKFTNPDGGKGDIGRKLSELRFPLDTYIAYANVDMMISQNWKVALGFWKNFACPQGPKMEDSDWGTWALDSYSWASDSTLDIFSRSDSKVVNAYSINADFLYRFTIVPGFDLSAGLGFIYRYFYFEVSNLDQWFPSYDIYKPYLDAIDPVYYSSHVYQDGKIGTYEVYYFIPFIELSTNITLFENFVIDITAGYSPLVKVLDADDHMLRYKISKGDSTGMAVLCDADFRYKFTPLFFAGVNANIMLIDASGTQKQIRYRDTPEGSAGPMGSIEMKINSLQFEAGVYIGMSY
jgi:hypothetical protein